jgi:hypothetical protein
MDAKQKRKKYEVVLSVQYFASNILPMTLPTPEVVETKINTAASQSDKAMARATTGVQSSNILCACVLYKLFCMLKCDFRNLEERIQRYRERKDEGGSCSWVWLSRPHILIRSFSISNSTAGWKMSLTITLGDIELKSASCGLAWDLSTSTQELTVESFVKIAQESLFVSDESYWAGCIPVHFTFLLRHCNFLLIVKTTRNKTEPDWVVRFCCK